MLANTSFWDILPKMLNKQLELIEVKMRPDQSGKYNK